MTTTLPGTVPSSLPTSGAGPHEWNYRGTMLFHNKQTRHFLPPLHDLTSGQRVGLLVTTNGQLHLFLDGQHRTEISTGLPVDTPLWGAADVYGHCTKIKSEILSGESGGVDYVCMKQLVLYISKDSIMLIIIIIQSISAYIQEPFYNAYRLFFCISKIFSSPSPSPPPQLFLLPPPLLSSLPRLYPQMFLVMRGLRSSSTRLWSRAARNRGTWWPSSRASLAPERRGS